MPIADPQPTPLPLGPTAPEDPAAWLDVIGRDWESLSDVEWLIGNGLGGYAMGTVAGANTRRYHGLLIAALTPPTGRRLVLAKIDEQLRTAVGTFDLTSNQWQDKVVAPQGYRHVKAFRFRPHPTWTFDVGGARLTKEICCVPGANTVQVRYTLDPDSVPADLDLIWLVNHRDPHAETQGRPEALYQQMTTRRGVVVQAHAGASPLSLAWERGAYRRTDVWHYHFHHRHDEERGQWATEDHYNPGITTVSLQPGDSVTVSASTDALTEKVAWQGDLPGDLDPGTDTDSPVLSLRPAAATYLVRRAELDSTSLIAGYPWFGEWGRDAMIALPGLTLVTGRMDQARELLACFIHYMDQGVIPNQFPDNGSAPEYNTLDATLWLFHALDRFWAYSQDDSLLELVFPRLAGAIDWYRRGTHHGIAMHSDGLLAWEAPGLALTWMDAKVGDWVVTPRQGKPVEINALWIHALRVMSAIARRLGEDDPYSALSSLASASFRTRFWMPDRGHLADRIGPENAVDVTCRPNQVLALAIPDPPLEPANVRQTLDLIDRTLWTPYGLRSLTPADSGYKGCYAGDRLARDGAYHQGTVWPWLVGPYARACLQAAADPDAERQRWRWRLQPLLDHVALEGCLGHVSELFDGDPPHRAKGCPAQAWSLAELLRTWIEEVEGKRPPGLTEPPLN